jgi:multifunctional beta-oxidation protein
MEVPKFAAPGSFANRTIIVTGGAGSIGHPLSIAFARAGANVVVNDLGGEAEGGGASPQAADRVVEEIQSFGGKAVADYNSVTNGERIVATAIANFGRIDVIVNNAGIVRHGNVESQSLEDFRSVFEVNTLGAISLTLAAWPYFQKQGYGRIVNFISDSVVGMRNLSSYIVSKAALIGATKSFALEGAEFGLLVNAVGPVAFSRMRGPTMPDEAEQERLKDLYSGEGNVPMILGLCHESSDISGRMFCLGSFNVSELVLGFKHGVSDARTMADCLNNRDLILGPGKEIYEASNINDLMAKRASGYRSLLT